MLFLNSLDWELRGTTNYASYIYARAYLCDTCTDGLWDLPICNGRYDAEPEGSGVNAGVLAGSIRFRDRGIEVNLVKGTFCPICGADVSDAGRDVRFIASLRPMINLD
jgi:hypothetical protein